MPTKAKKPVKKTAKKVRRHPAFSLDNRLWYNLVVALRGPDVDFLSTCGDFSEIADAPIRKYTLKAINKVVDGLKYAYTARLRFLLLKDYNNCPGQVRADKFLYEGHVEELLANLAKLDNEVITLFFRHYLTHAMDGVRAAVELGYMSENEGLFLADLMNLIRATYKGQIIFIGDDNFGTFKNRWSKFLED